MRLFNNHFFPGGSREFNVLEESEEKESSFSSVEITTKEVATTSTKTSVPIEFNQDKKSWRSEYGFVLS
jgi:hypothetical protein